MGYTKEELVQKSNKIIIASISTQIKIGEKMKNPNRSRKIMFIIMFAGLLLFGIAAYGERSTTDYVKMGIGVIIIIYSTIYGVRNVRCPYCNALLSLKIMHNFKCPYCGKKID